MLYEPEISNSNDSNWAERSDYWLRRCTASARKTKRHEDNPSALILNGHGVSMRIEHGALVIRDGFTHYPQTQIKYHYWPGQPSLPTRILLLEGSGTLSFDVLSWLAAQNIPMARINWDGTVATVASGTGFAADPEKVRWQLDTRADLSMRLRFAAALIVEKLTASIDTLRLPWFPAERVRLAISQMERSIGLLKSKRFTSVQEIMGIEGGCASLYFQTWGAVTFDWKGIERRPIPPEWYEFRGRADHARGKGPSNRNATHPVNAILNYAYTVASAQLQIQAMAEGYDPSIGLLHETMPGRSAFILDVIEPVRPVIDAKILYMLKHHTLDPTDFIIRKDGVCRLSPQFARKVTMVVETILPLHPVALTWVNGSERLTGTRLRTDFARKIGHSKPEVEHAKERKGTKTRRAK